MLKHQFKIAAASESRASVWSARSLLPLSASAGRRHWKAAPETDRNCAGKPDALQTRARLSEVAIPALAPP